MDVEWFLPTPRLHGIEAFMEAVGHLGRKSAASEPWPTNAYDQRCVLFLWSVWGFSISFPSLRPSLRSTWSAQVELSEIVEYLNHPTKFQQARVSSAEWTPRGSPRQPGRCSLAPWCLADWLEPMTQKNISGGIDS